MEKSYKMQQNTKTYKKCCHHFHNFHLTIRFLGINMSSIFDQKLDEFTGRGRHQNSGIILLGEFDGLVTNYTKKEKKLVKMTESRTALCDLTNKNRA